MILYHQIHGDSKIDNFLCKKVVYAVETEYTAVLVDWQGACYDFLSSDLIWSLYGFMKNLPEKNTTVDTFLDYSLAYYHNELTKNLKGFGLQCADCDLPEGERELRILHNPRFCNSCAFLQTLAYCTLGFRMPRIFSSTICISVGCVSKGKCILLISFINVRKVPFPFLNNSRLMYRPSIYHF